MIFIFFFWETQNVSLFCVYNTAMKSLYCYFGALGTKNNLDIPGHTFYQLPLLEAIADHLKTEPKFDFFSYLPDEVYYQATGVDDFHKDAIGNILSGMFTSMIEEVVSYETLVYRVIQRETYNKIILKARFRNLSTLTKKWNDAAIFESIINMALQEKFEPKNIVILDTDLSLPIHFIEWARTKGLTILIPSIDFQPMLRGRAENFLNAVEAEPNIFNTVNGFMYYGNLDTKNYKSGHSKNPIASECIAHAAFVNHFGYQYIVDIAGKVADEDKVKTVKELNLINRSDRDLIWNEMIRGKVCLNVSKDLYVERGFIPARVYEGLMLGMIPVSYMMPKIHPAMSFSSLGEFSEIIKYILELDMKDYTSLRRKVVDSLLGPLG